MAEELNDVQAIAQAVVDEFRKTELAEERRRREAAEQRVNELTIENSRAKAVAEEADRGAAIRAELQKLGVAKVDLAYKAVKDEIERGNDGQLQARGGEPVREFLAQFVGENPELLPARLSGGSGAGGNHRPGTVQASMDLDRIQPGMSAEEKDRIRQEIARVASQTLRGLG